MKYIEFINELIKIKVSEVENIVLFGQNINTGSYLGGLTRHLKVRKGSYIINTPNSENSLTGIGFGLMLGGVSAIFFMKQLDFLLLGVDHLVNTYNFIRVKDCKVSYTIMPIVVDSGYQGMQSSLNNLADFCSIARIPGYTITNKHDAQVIINSQLINPGFRIIGVSQRMFNMEILECEDVFYVDEDSNMFQYTDGKDVSIVCFNFSFPYGLELYNRLKNINIKASLFTINLVTPIRWDRIIENLKQTNKLVIIDDSKCENISCYSLVKEVFKKKECQINKYILIKREFSNNWYRPNSEAITIDYENIIEEIVSEKANAE